MFLTGVFTNSGVTITRFRPPSKSGRISVDCHKNGYVTNNKLL